MGNKSRYRTQEGFLEVVALVSALNYEKQAARGRKEKKEFWEGGTAGTKVSRCDPA